MKKLFVPYSIAIKLKEKGFNEECFMWWYSPTQISDDLIFRQYKSEPDFCEAPTHQQVTDWLREKHSIVVEVRIDGKLGYLPFVFKDEDDFLKETPYYIDYYEALITAIEESLKLIP